MAAKKSEKDRILYKIKSLHLRDEERTSISKKISWILRTGAAEAGVKQDKDLKWVKFSDLCECCVLNEYSKDEIWRVIVDFNGKKLRYEILEEADGTRIRAYQRSEKTSKEGKPEKRSADTSAKPGGSQALRADAAVFAPQANTDSASSPNAVAAYAAQIQQMGYPPWYPMMPPFMNPYMWQQVAAAQAAQAGKYQGRIKSFNVEKGFGFIECQQTHAQFSRDVFLHKAQIGDLQIGSVVSFSCEVNKNNMPQAKDVKLVAPPMPAAVAAAVTGKGAGKDGGEGKGRGKGRGKGGKKGKEGGKGKESKGDKNDEKEEPAKEETAAADAEAKAE